jgi:hypothetical protein
MNDNLAVRVQRNETRAREYRIIKQEEVKGLPENYISDLIKQDRSITFDELYNVILLAETDTNKFKSFNFFLSKIKLLPQEYENINLMTAIIAGLFIPENEIGIGINMKRIVNIKSISLCDSKNSFSILQIDVPINMQSRQSMDITSNLSIHIPNDIFSSKNITYETTIFNKNYNGKAKYDRILKCYKINFPNTYWITHPFIGDPFIVNIKIQLSHDILFDKNMLHIFYTYIAYFLPKFNYRLDLMTFAQTEDYNHGKHVGEYLF